MQTPSFIAFPSVVAFASTSSVVELALATAPSHSATAVAERSAPQSTLVAALPHLEELLPFVVLAEVALLVAMVVDQLHLLEVILAALLATANLALRFPFQNKLTIPINSNN